MSNGNSLTGFKVGKLYVCRNPLPMEYDEWWWVLFAGINNWDEKTNKLYENDTFMVLEIFSDIATVNEFNEYENWIKVLTDAGVIGWFKYSSGHYEFFELVEEIKSC
jgi:hypothetical protein